MGRRRKLGFAAAVGIAIAAALLALHDPSGERAPPGRHPPKRPAVPADAGEPTGDHGSIADEDAPAASAPSFRVRGWVLGGTLDPLPRDVKVHVHALDEPWERLGSFAAEASGAFAGTVAPGRPLKGLLFLAQSEQRSLRSQPVEVRCPAKHEEVQALLLLVAGSRLRFRIVRPDGAPIPFGAALVSELPQTTFRAPIPAWESGAHQACDRLVRADAGGVVAIWVREGDVSIRVGGSADGPFGVPRKERVPALAGADLGDLPVPTEMVTCILRFADRDGPVAARVRTEGRTLRFRHALTGDEVYHFRVGAEGRMMLEIPAAALPLPAAADSERHFPVGFVIRNEGGRPQDVRLRRRPERTIRLVDPTGAPVVADVAWSADLGARWVDPPPADAELAKSLAWRVLAEMAQAAVVLDGPEAGSYRLVTATPGRVRLHVAFEGGFGVDTEADVADEATPPLEVVVQRGGQRRIAFVATGNLTLATHRALYPWRIRWSASSGDMVPHSSTIRAQVNGAAVTLWIPDALDTLVAEDASGAFRAVGPTPVVRQGVTELEATPVAGAALVRLVPSIDDRDPLGLKGIVVVLSGGEGDLRAMATADDGAVSVVLPSDTYRAGLFPRAGPMRWQTLVVDGAAQELLLPVR